MLLHGDLHDHRADDAGRRRHRAAAGAGAPARGEERTGGRRSTARATFFVDENRLRYDEFRASFKALAAQRGHGGIYLRADEGVPYGTVVQVLAVMRAAGVGDVGLVAEPEAIAR